MTDKILEFGTFEETRDGVPLKYKISTVPSEIVDDLVEHMAVYFIPREPLCSHTKLAEDPRCMKAARDLWKQLIEEGASLVALAERAGKLKDRILGANITYVASKDRVDEVLVEWGKFSEVYLGVKEATKRANIFEKYGVDKYLAAFGLSVHPDYHGYHIGERLLQCREPLCRQIGIKVTGTIFTASASQYLSKKIGFKVEYEEEYSKFRFEGKILFDGLPGKFEYSVLAY